MTSHFLDVSDLAVSYEKNKKTQELIKVVKNLNLHLDKGEIGCFLGYSGCGKTTALRAIAGLEQVDNGQIFLDNVKLTDSTNVQKPSKSNTSHILSPSDRGMGMVFQDYALFGHLSISDNIAFGLHKWKKDKRVKRVTEMLELVELTEHAHKKPSQISGGQQQRVALARALAPEPKLLLLDEPFSNLDVVLRESLAMSVRKILKHTNTTAILVTHDQNEAFALADKVGVMHEGKLVQWATPTDLYHKPATPFVASFIGEGAMLNAVVNQGSIDTPLGKLPIKNTYTHNSATKLSDGSIQILIRPDAIVHDENSKLYAKVISRVFRGANNLYLLELNDGQTLYSLTSSHYCHEVNSKIGIVANLQHSVVFSK